MKSTLKTRQQRFIWKNANKDGIACNNPITWCNLPPTCQKSFGKGDDKKIFLSFVWRHLKFIFSLYVSTVTLTLPFLRNVLHCRSHTIAGVQQCQIWYLLGVKEPKCTKKSCEMNLINDLIFPLDLICQARIFYLQLYEKYVQSKIS